MENPPKLTKLCSTAPNRRVFVVVDPDDEDPTRIDTFLRWSDVVAVEVAARTTALVVRARVRGDNRPRSACHLLAIVSPLPVLDGGTDADREVWKIARSSLDAWVSSNVVPLLYENTPGMEYR